MAIKMKYYVNIYLCFGVLSHSSEIFRKSFEAGETVVINCNDHHPYSTVHIVNISIPNPDLTCPYSKNFAFNVQELVNETNQICNTETSCVILPPTHRDLNMFYICKDAQFDCSSKKCSWINHGFNFRTPEHQNMSLPIGTDTAIEDEFAYSETNGSYLQSPPLSSGPKCISLEYSSISAKLLVYKSSEDNISKIAILAPSKVMILNEIVVDLAENNSVILMMKTNEDSSMNASLKVYSIVLEEGTCNDERTIYVDFDTFSDNGWNKLSTNTKYSWTRCTGGESSRNCGIAGPYFDHSTSQGNGSYLSFGVMNYVYALNAEEPYVNATFQSPAYFKIGSNGSRSWSISCLQVWYYMYGDNSSILNVYSVSSDGNRLVLSSVRHNEPSGIWKKLSLTVTDSADITFEFEGAISKNGSSISIDDISIKHGRCTEEKHLTYIMKTGHFCFKTSSTAETLSCISQMSDEDRVNIGFHSDIFRTTSHEFKKCKNIEKEIEIRFNDECKRYSTIAEITECAQRIQRVVNQHEQCMVLPVAIDVDYMCLEVYRKSFQAGEDIFINCRDHHYHSTVQIVNITLQNPDVTCPYPNAYPFEPRKLVTEANQRCNTETCDIVFPMLEPTYRDMNMYYVCKDEKLNCKYGRCSWTHRNFTLMPDQQRISEPTSKDTTMERPFAYSNINGSYFRSPPMTSGPKCLSIKYSAVSANIVGYLGSEEYRQHIFTLPPSSLKDVKQNKIDLKGMESSTVILMMIAMENGTDMNVNIYNIALEEGTCNDETTLHVDFDGHPDHRWSKSSTDAKYGWITRNGNQASSYYGMLRPFFDHSTLYGNGTYLTLEIIEYTGEERFVNATFESPTYFGNDRPEKQSWEIGCVQFWYYMYGDKSSTLVVWKTFTDGNRQNVSSISNNERSGIWQKHSLTLTNLTDKTIKIAFEGIVKARSSIAIDDISIKYGRCHEETMFTYTMHTGPLCQEPSSTSSTLSCISKMSDENRVNIGFEPDIIQTNTDEYKKCKDIEKQIEIRFNDECKIKSTAAEMIGCAQQIQRDNKHCMILPNIINVDYTCLGNTETVPSPGTTLQDVVESTQKTSTVADSLYTTKSLGQSVSSPSSKGIVIGVTSGILIVAVAIIIAVLVIKRSYILEKFNRTPIVVDENAFKMDKHVSTNGDKGKTTNQQYNECHKSGNFEHVYNTIEGGLDTEKNSQNSIKYQIENRVSGANDKDGYAVLKEVNIYDQITQDEQKGSSSKALSNDMNSKQFDNEQSNDYVVLDPNESGCKRKGKIQEGIKSSDEENRNDQTLTSDEVKTDPMDNKIEKGNDYGILDPNETGYDRSGLSNMTDNTILHVDMGSKVTPELATEDYSVLDLNGTGFHRTIQSTEINKTGFNPPKRAPEFNTSDDYTILDPNATGFCRTADANRPIDNPSAASVQDNDMTYEKAQPISHPYELAKPIEQANENAKEDIDEIKGQQSNYGHDVNIYSHCVDDVYDVSSHFRKKAERDSTYGYSPNKKELNK